MKYFFTFAIAFLFVLPPSVNSQSEAEAQLEKRVKERTERQREIRERMKERRDQIRERMEERQKDRKQQIEERVRRHRERTRELKARSNKRTLVSSPDKAFLGIESNSISKEKAQKLGFDNPYGSYVSKIIQNTAAEKADLQPFDYIFGIDDHRTSREEDLSDILAKYEAGDGVALHFIRKGKKKTVMVVLGKRGDAKWDVNHSEDAFFGINHRMGKEKERDGVMVSVVKNSTADEMGLKNGDIITSINGYPIIDWDDVTTAIDNMKPDEIIEVAYVREGKKMTGKQAIKSHAESYGRTIVEPEPKKEITDYAFLGVYTEDISKEKARKLGCDNPYGSFVTGVIPNTAAAKAGIQKMDYLFGIDEYRTGEHQSLTGILKKYKPGDRGVVQLVRKGKKTKVNVTFGNRNDVQDKVEKEDKKDKCEDAFFGITSSGKSSDMGVRINIVKNSTAGDLGMQNGDVILTLNDYVMTDWNDIKMAIDMLKPGETIAVGYEREGKKMKASKPIKSYAETKNCKNCDCDERYTYEEQKDADRDFDFNFDYDFGEEKEDPEGRMDLSNVSVNVETLSPSECDILKSKGADISSAANLPVNDFSLKAIQNRGIFELKFILPGSGPTAVRAFNESGRLIYDYDLGTFSGDFEDNIDLAQNGTGTYYLHIGQGNKSLTKKIELSKN